MGRPGNPFDLQSWRIFEEWLRAQVEKHIPRGSHVVLMDEPHHNGLPAHVAIEPPWSVSYAADWRGVVEAAEASAQVLKPTALGVVTVPSANESQKMIRVFEETGITARRLAAASRIKFEHLSGVSAIQDEIARLLGQCDVAKIVCHGYLVAETQEVVLLVAQNGNLPARSSVGIAGAASRGFRMGWNEFSALDRMPRTIFLGVCGGGATNVRGVQERVGLFGPMSSSGTRALIAPRWKIHASTVLPIVDEILETWLHSGKPLAHVVRDVQASVQDAGCERWHALALALEGGWR